MDPKPGGGASKSEVIIAAGEIDFPEVIIADVLIALSQEAYDKYVRNLKAGGLLIVDTDQVQNVPG
jgi:2-oxoglutarate ferredoxin oxidoreductase subunit gamma